MGKRILAVDDETVVLGAVKKALRKIDCSMDTAETAETALKLLSEWSYDLVITDLLMPGMDGLELIQHMRKERYSAQVIVITGYPTIQSALKARRLGAFEYVTKPFTRQELVSVVVRALRRGDLAPVETGPSGAQESRGDTYYIPEHSWARIAPDGTAHMGMARTFASTIGEIAEVKLPAQGDLLEQGKMCVVMRAADGVEHHLYSPFSGRVIGLNEMVLKDPQLASRDPEGSGWLLHIALRDFDRELPNLTPV